MLYLAPRRDHRSSRPASAIWSACVGANMVPLQYSWIGNFSESPTNRHSGIEKMRGAFQTTRLAGMVPFGLHDAPCQTPHTAYATVAYLNTAGSNSSPGFPAGTDSHWILSSGYQPHQRRGAWPAIVSGNRRPDSHPSQRAIITRPEWHLHYPAERENLVAGSRIERLSPGL